MESAYIASHLHDGPHLEIPVVEDDCVEEFTESTDGVTEPKINNKNLTKCERWAIYKFLLVRKKNPQYMDSFDLVRGALSDAAAKFNMTRPTISAIWKRAKESRESSNLVPNVSACKIGNVGRKKVELDIDRMKAVPLLLRQNLCSLSAHTSVAKTTLIRCLKERAIKHHSNVIKPLLSYKNRRDRVEWCLLHVALGIQPTKFDDMMNVVHIDEKWF